MTDGLMRLLGIFFSHFWRHKSLSKNPPGKEARKNACVCVRESACEKVCACACVWGKVIMVRKRWIRPLSVLLEEKGENPSPFSFPTFLLAPSCHCLRWFFPFAQTNRLTMSKTRLGKNKGGNLEWDGFCHFSAFVFCNIASFYIKS